jgi:hypothetical protein
MNTELLIVVPVSGSVRERHYDVSGTRNAWVRFDSGTGDEWVGVFGAAEPSQFYAVVPFADDAGATVLVIAGGQGYVVDVQSGDLLRRTQWWDSQTVIALPERDFMLVADDTTAWATDRTVDRPVWRREHANYDSRPRSSAQRLALDGIVFQTATSDRVIGRVWEPEGWYSCSIDLSTLEFIRESFLSADWQFESDAPAV